MVKVFIGVGHGGIDSGAYANGVKEKDLNLPIALACNEVLTRHGVTTLMSRTKDENDTLDEEIAECNKWTPDLAVDIHNNAGGGDGAEAFYSHVGGRSKTLAENVLAEIKAIGQNSRGAKTRLWGLVDYYGFIRETKCDSIIVECAFVDNKADMKIIDTPEERKRMGEAIAKGILKTLGIAFKEETHEKTYTVKAGDSLWAIAEKCLGDGSRYWEIKSFNGLTSNLIHAGDVLKIPSGREVIPVSYTVKAGDSLWAIAEKCLGNGLRWGEIKALNGLTSNLIFAGQILKLPE